MAAGLVLMVAPAGAADLAPVGRDAHRHEDLAAADRALHTDPTRRADLFADARTEPTAMPEIVGGC